MSETQSTEKTAAPDRFSILGKRLVSAFVLMPVTIGAVWVGGPVFAALVGFLCVLMIFEWTRMVERRELSASYYILALAAAPAMFFSASGRFLLAMALLGAAAAGSLAATALRGRANFWPGLAVPYIAIPSLALIWLRTAPEMGRDFAFWLFFTVWAADSGAFFFGKFIGGPKISHALSPSKTWAGIGGGIAGGAVIGVVAGCQLFEIMPFLPSLAAGAALGAVSVAGDLFESALKRRFGVKDISAFIPGHGGVLDRLDGMIFATIAMTGAAAAAMLIEKVQG